MVKEKAAYAPRRSYLVADTTRSLLTAKFVDIDCTAECDVCRRVMRIRYIKASRLCFGQRADA